MDTTKEILKKYWGFDSFRPKQEGIINDLINGKDVFALLPTGGGKSLCYQLPALMKEGITIVISPLISLMQDQVSQLNQKGIKAFLPFYLIQRQGTIPRLAIHIEDWCKILELTGGDELEIKTIQELMIEFNKTTPVSN